MYFFKFIHLYTQQWHHSKFTHSECLSIKWMSDAETWSLRLRLITSYCTDASACTSVRLPDCTGCDWWLDLSKGHLWFRSQKSYQMLRIFSQKVPFLQKLNFWQSPSYNFEKKNCSRFLHPFSYSFHWNFSWSPIFVSKIKIQHSGLYIQESRRGNKKIWL